MDALQSFIYLDLENLDFIMKYLQNTWVIGYTYTIYYTELRVMEIM